MKKRHVLCSLMAATLLSAAMTPAVAALNWKDGALANYYFTYTGNNGGIESVTAFDKNGTFNGVVEIGNTIKTQTGTIAWRDSYTNVTTFNVDVETGYELVSLVGNHVEPKDFVKNEDGTYTFQFTDKGAETILDKVSFNLETEKIEYTLVDAEGNHVGDAKIEEAINIKDENPTKEGHTFAGWKIVGTDTTINDGAQLTEEMIAAANDNNEIKVDAEFTVNAYDVTINVYDDNTTGKPVSTLDTKVDYGTVIDEEWLKAKGYLTEEYCLVGGKGITVGTEGNVVNLVKYTSTEDDYLSHEYGFLYNSKDEGIVSVEYSIDSGDWTRIDVNEGVKLETGLGSSTITFRVKVAEGKKLVLTVNAGDNDVTRDGEYYTFSFTRTGHQGLPGTSNIPNVSFGLFTEAEPVVEAPAGETVEAAVLVPAEEVTETVEAEVIVPTESATETVEAEVIVPAEPVAETVEEVVAE